MSNFFNEEEEFRDVPDEVKGEHAPVPQMRTPPAPPPQYTYDPEPDQNYSYDDNYTEDTETDQEEDYSYILTDAKLRLEQGRLYEMLLNHDLFGDVDADERAIRHITRQIRKFAREQMEIMLGMRQEKVLSTNSSPFTDAEIDALKQLAYVASKGKTATQAPKSPGPSLPPKTNIINTLSTPKTAPKQPATIQPPKQQKPQPTQSRPLTKKPSAPIQRTKTDATVDAILRETGVTREEFERQYGNSGLSKPVHQMTADELLERNKAVQAKKAINPNAMPMPTADQEQMIYAQRATENNSPGFQAILNAVLTQAAKK